MNNLFNSQCLRSNTKSKMRIITKYAKFRSLLNVKGILRSSCMLSNKINVFDNKEKYPMATVLLNQRLRTNRVLNQWTLLTSRFYASKVVENDSVDANKYETVCEETLCSLCEYFEELVESSNHLQSADVSYSGGVLTVNFGAPYGTYVINRQSPNKQIWLSSPTSGPKRYDFVANGEYWIYRHDGITLHQLLQKEIPEIVKSTVDFTQCSHSRL